MYLTIDDQNTGITYFGNSARYWTSAEELIKYLKKRCMQLKNPTARLVTGKPLKLEKIRMNFRAFLLTRNDINGPSVYYISPNEDKFPVRISGNDLVWLAEEVGILRVDEDPIENKLILATCFGD